MANRIRIELDGPTAMTGRVFYIQADGSEVEISNAITGLEVKADIDGATKATLHCILVGGRISADLEEIVARHVKPRKRWMRRLIDVTTFGHLSRQYVRGG